MRSRRQTLLLILISIALLVAIVVNVVLAWFYNSAYVSRIEVKGAASFEYLLLNSASLDFDRGEVYAGNTLYRTVRLEGLEDNPDVYFRIKTEFRINGRKTNEISLFVYESSLSDPVQRSFVPEDKEVPSWYYCTDIIPSGSRISPRLEFKISDTLQESLEGGFLSIVITVETVSIATGLTEWSYLPNEFLELN